MSKVKNLFSFLFFAAFTFTSCSKDDNCAFSPENPGPRVDITIERLEHQILNLTKRQEVDAFVKSEPLVAEVFLRQYDYPDEEVFYDALIDRFSNPHIDTLEMEIDRVFGDLSWLEEELEEAFTLLKYYYPDREIPKVKTVATGFDYDLHLTDSVIVIGLDYYLGPEAKYRPMGSYNYILKRYDAPYIVPSIMLLYGISPTINKYDPRDGSILADMVSYGKSFYFAKRMLPCTPDSTLIWYTGQEIAGVKQNADIVWSHFIEKDLLFETDHLIKKKYIDERPKTFEIGPECPARIGQWVGWNIVDTYMEEYPETTLPDLMEMTNARELFDDSKFRPGR